MEALRSWAHEVSSSPLNIAKAYMEGLKSELANIERKTIKSSSFPERLLTEEYFMNQGKPFFPMPKRSYALNDSLAQVNPIWYAHQLNRLRNFSERSSPFCASNCAPSVMESLHDFRGAISAYQNPQRRLSKGSFRNFSYIRKDDDMFRSPVGTVRTQSSRMGQRTLEHLDRSVNPKRKSQDQATTLSESIPLKSMTMAPSIGGGSSYVPALQPTLSEYATLFMDSQGRGPDMDVHEHASPEQYPSSPSTRKFENMGSNVDMKMSNDLKTSPLGGREMGTHVCEGQEKDFASRCKSVDRDLAENTTRIVEKATQHFEQSLSPNKIPEVLDLTFSTLNSPRKPANQLSQLQEKDALSRGKSGDVDLTLENPSCAHKSLQHSDQFVCQNNVPQVLELTFEMPKARRKPAIKVSRFTQKDFASRCKSVDRDLTEDTTKIVEKASQHFEQSLSPNKMPEVLDLTFSTPNFPRKPAIQLSQLQEKDAPSRCKSRDIDPAPKIDQKVSEHTDQSLSPKNISEVLELTFAMPNPRRKSSTFLMHGQDKRLDLRTSLEHRTRCLVGNEFDSSDSEDTEEAYSESSDSESEHAEHYGPPTKRRKYMTIALA